MFTSHPWTYYLIIVSTLLVGYYLVIGIKFYAYDIKMLIQTRRGRSLKITEDLHQQFIKQDSPDLTFNPAKSSSNEVNEPNQDEEPPVWEHEELFDQTEKLAIRLKEIIAQAHDKEDNKDELIEVLQLALKEYMVLNGTPFQTAINNLIESECAANGFQHLSADEKVLLWKQVV